MQAKAHAAEQYEQQLCDRERQINLRESDLDEREREIEVQKALVRVMCEALVQAQENSWQTELEIQQFESGLQVDERLKQLELSALQLKRREAAVVGARMNALGLSTGVLRNGGLLRPKRWSRHTRPHNSKLSNRHIRMPACLPACLSVYLSACLLVYLSACLPAYLPT